MPANPTGKPYALYIWLDPDGEGEPNDIEYFDAADAVESRAKRLIGAGRFKYLWAGRLNPARDDYDQIDDFFGKRS